MFSALSGICWLREKLLSADYCHITPYNEALVHNYPSEALSQPNVDKIIAEAQQKAKQLARDKSSLLKLLTLIDLTTLNATDTPETVKKLFNRALSPLDENLAEKLALTDQNLLSCHCAAVCVYPLRLVDVQKELNGVLWSGRVPREHVPLVASVAAGFPSGQYHMESKMLEVQLGLRDGAQEIDIVIDRSIALRQQWIGLYNSLCCLRRVSARMVLKTILATGELENNENIYRASMVAMLAGADFIKTSTGKESVNATLESAAVMCTAIKTFQAATGKRIGFKAAGGIKTCEQAMAYVFLVQTILGQDYFHKDFLRIGASSLLDDVIKNLHDS